ncbi:hypothetical protein [Microbacterium lacus]|uniref:hypothetical protein n=1 Tax=Microbacterium lacus TaxID=415217 RepID=UPI0018E2899D|nr:hypothetical protein [Microbacterium lacus]
MKDPTYWGPALIGETLEVPGPVGFTRDSVATLADVYADGPSRPGERFRYWVVLESAPEIAPSADAVTDSEAAELALRRPLNWDELGSSAKDLWEERQLRSMRRATGSPETSREFVDRIMSQCRRRVGAHGVCRDAKGHAGDCKSRQFGVLFSHAPDGEVDGPYLTWDDAGARSASVRQAQPGIESTLMVREAGGEWRMYGGRDSLRHLGALELQRTLWASL